MTPASFLELLWAEKPDPMYILIWVRQGKTSHWFRDVRSADEFVRCELGRDVYVGVGLSRSDCGEVNRCVSGEIAGLAGMWADLDLKSEAHDGKALPASISDALKILPPLMHPSLLVSTGNGVHAWWLFKEPYIFDSDEERKDVIRLVSRWHTMLRLRAAAHGWAYDCLSDLARLLRVPNTKNYKDPANPKEVTVLSQAEHRYNLQDFEELLDEAGIPDKEAEEKGARAWAERFADTPLSINRDA
jgi:putative DNA primase/helicase